MKTILKRTGFVIAALLLSFLCLMESVFSVKASAETTTEYTSVLDDLQKDENFNVEMYPAVADDYSLQVIQIAESSNGELFVYVYQPSAGKKNLTATTIRMSMPMVGIDSTWQDYDMTLLSSESVFQKYKVEGVTVKDDAVRYYDITAIHRKFDETIDKAPTTNTENTINEVVYEVAQLWTLQTNETGKISYSMKTTEVIHITAKVVGFIRYLDGYVPFYLNNYTDSHFVAFSTDRKIDDLLEADISYVTQSYEYITQLGRETETFGEEVSIPLSSIEKQNTGSNTGEGIFGKKYEWHRIEDRSTFLNENKDDITFIDGATSDLEKCDWILRFYESDYEEGTVGNAIVEKSTRVSEVTILRLKFVTDGVPYNLGVVDNKQTGSKDPLGTADTKLDDFMEKTIDLFVALIILMGAGLLLSVVPGVGAIFGLVFNALMKAIGWAFKAICFAIKWIFKGVFFVIAFPFNLIGKLFKRNKKNE